MLLDFVKGYLKITTNDFDNILEGLIQAFFNSHRYLLYGKRSVISHLSQTPPYSISYLRSLPASFITVKAGNDLNHENFEIIPLEDVKYNSDNGLLKIKGIYQYCYLELYRGYDINNLPAWLNLEVAKFVAIEFKRSFQGEGGLIYSGRTVGDVSFNFYQDFKETIDDIHRKVTLYFWGWDEIEEFSL